MDAIDDAMSEVGSDAEATVEKAKQACACSCCGFLLMPILLLCLYGNEKEYACTQNAILAIGDVVQSPTSCTAKAGKKDDAIFLQNCDVTDLAEFSGTDWGLPSLTGVKFKGAAAKMLVEMYQCTEHVHSNKKEGGGTYSTYTYSKGWSASYEGALSSPGDASAKKAACGSAPNPSLSETPLANHMGTTPMIRTASDLKAGKYLLDEGLINDIQPFNAVPLSQFSGAFSASAPSAPPYNVDNGHFKVSGNYLTSCPGATKIGCVRLSFTFTTAAKASVMGGLATADKIGEWKAPETMICKDTTVRKLWVGSKTKDEAIASLNSENTFWTQLKRFLLWLACWLAMYMAFYPLYAIIDIAGDWLDNIPCIGDWLEDFIENLAGAMLCVGSCLCGTFFALFVISISWCIVRPMIGIPLLIVSLLLGGGILYWRSTMPPSKRKRKAMGGSGSESEMESFGDSG